MPTDYPAITRARLQQVLDRWLTPAVHAERCPIEVSALTVPDPISYDDAVAGEYRPFAVGEPWGRPWGTTWFRLSGHVPAAWREQSVALVLDLGGLASTGFTCEALAWKGGRPWRGVSPNHRSLPVEGESVDLLVEAAANPKAPWSGPDRAPSMLALRDSRELLFVLRQAELVRSDELVRQLELDFRVLLELALALGEEPRALEILAALNRCANRLDPRDISGSARGAHGELAAALASSAAPSAPLITAVGHAHIDTAWLWPLREARRKCARTFATVLALMEGDPAFRFACSQALHYQWMKDAYPDLFRRIGEAVGAGRWEPIGGMWVEPDCNLPNGESLVRQLLYGTRFFQREFGHASEVAFLPDVFGYSAALPQLFRQAGMRFFVTQKLSWNQFNRLPHHTFWWEGLDGSRVLAHFPPADTYNGTFEVGEVLSGVRSYSDSGRTRHSLYLFGHGDGGGGPEADMLEVARRLADLDGSPRVRLGTAAQFCEAVAGDADAFAVWTGELYFERHRGTYTTQARTKRLNRKTEQALREAELWCTAAAARDSTFEYPGEALEAAWKKLLVNQFHDILPGSSIDWVYQDAERALAEALADANRLAGEATGRLAADEDEHAFTVFNCNGHSRAEVVSIDDQQQLVDVPPCGWKVFKRTSTDSGNDVSVRDGLLENDLLRIRWERNGLLTSIWDKQVDREVLAGEGNLLQLHDDYPLDWDAWDIDLPYRETVLDIREPCEISIEPHGLIGGVRFRRTVGSSLVEQRMALSTSSRVLRFETEIDWREEHRLLKAAFPVHVRSPRATYEIQFGHVERPTHENTSWDLARFEVCGQRWADLGEPGYGVALLNDCKYGYDIHGSVMRLTLLRAPTYPDPSADAGRHTFVYALMPHPGDFREARVIEAAEDLNLPLRVVSGRGSGSLERQLFALDTRQVVLETVKRAEDSSAVICRLYEAWGGRCTAQLRTSLPVQRAWRADVLENEHEPLELRDGIVELSLEPFKIVTVKLELAGRGS
jgi:alpha-mannosidase